MRKSDLTCPECKAGYRKLELISKKGVGGEFRCLVCDHILEVMNGCTEIAIRLTVQPGQIFGRDRNLSVKIRC
jgi:rubredoxin